MILSDLEGMVVFLRDHGHVTVSKDREEATEEGAKGE
jgi:hypothetical protein